MLAFKRPAGPGLNPGITVLDLATGQRQNLTTTQDDAYPAISWDGGQVAYKSGSSIYVMQNGQARNLVEGDLPTWSPDDAWIAYERWHGEGIWVIPSSGGTAVRVADSAEWCYGRTATSWYYSSSGPEWGASNQIVYQKGCRIYVMNADGSGRRQLTGDLTADYDPTWSPDGKQIAFVSQRNGHAELFVMNADGSDQTALPLTGFEHISHLSWSP